MFGKKTLASIQSSFTKIVEDLRVLQSENYGQIAQNNEKIEELSNANLALVGENEKAKRFEDKLNSLLE
jgi:hypothetical protein